jgi:hypothetical protein
LNYVAGQTVPNLVISQVGAGGTVCLFVSEGTHLVADVTGYFPPGSEFESLVPARLLETRADLPTADGQFQGTGALGRDSTLALPVAGRGGVPANATAVVLNITATGPSGPGFVTAYPCGGARPVASNLNFVAGQTVPNLAIVRLSSDGTVCLYAMESTHLIADVEGYFTPDSSFGSLVPARLLETRAGLPTVDGQFQGGGPVGRGSTLTLTVNGRGGVPGNADSVVLNVTATEAAGPGFITVYPCGQPQPVASSLNYSTGQTVPNSVIAKVGSNGSVCLFASEATHLIADVAGYFPPAP